MKSCEAYVNSKSKYYVYSPSLQACHTFFYPICIGHFLYEKGYYLHRKSYDSYLLMYIEKGSLTLEYENGIYTVHKNEFIFIDCYKPHSYYSDTGWEAIWVHFDGPMACTYYEQIKESLGNVFSISESYPCLNTLNTLYNVFATNSAIREPLISKYITDILTEFLLYSPQQTSIQNMNTLVEATMSYISEHINEELTIDNLAAFASLSPYYFIRVFKKETGFTPHEYIVHTRINLAKYLLNTTHMTIKDICFSTGFSSESVFSTCFKKNTGITPKEYRFHD